MRLAALLLAGCVDAPTPEPDLQELGRKLFHDVRLSDDGQTACSSCHEQALAFSDGRALPVGAHGTLGVRNSMGLANAGALSPLGWANPALGRLEQQILVPLFGETPVELGLAVRRDTVLYALSDAYDVDLDQGLVVDALAAFTRALVALDAPYDRGLSGEAAAGEALFSSDRLGCVGCHPPPLFTVADGTHPDPFFDTRRGGLGLFEATLDRADEGRYRPPSLRQVADTAPYLHDGRAPDLGTVLDTYEAGAGGTPFALSDDERSALLAFLDALSDRSFLDDETLSDPWK
jgi:cytochrome c peroxidase